MCSGWPTCPRVGVGEAGPRGREGAGASGFREQRNSGAGRKEELTRWGRLVSDVASGAVRAERGVRRRQVGPAAQESRARGPGGVAVERACWAGSARGRGPLRGVLGRCETGEGRGVRAWVCFGPGSGVSWVLGFAFSISLSLLFLILIQTQSK